MTATTLAGRYDQSSADSRHERSTALDVLLGGLDAQADTDIVDEISNIARRYRRHRTHEADIVDETDVLHQHLTVPLDDDEWPS